MFGLRSFLPPDCHALWQLVWRTHCKACALPIRRTKHKHRILQHEDSTEHGHLDVPWSRNPNDPACPTGQLPHHFLYLLLVPLSCNHKITFTCLRLLTLAYTPVAVCCCGWSHRTIEGPHGRHIRPRHAAKVCSSRYLKRHQWQKITACNLPWLASSANLPSTSWTALDSLDLHLAFASRKVLAICNKSPVCACLLCSSGLWRSMIGTTDDFFL